MYDKKKPQCDFERKSQFKLRKHNTVYGMLGTKQKREIKKRRSLDEKRKVVIKLIF